MTTSTARSSGPLLLISLFASACGHHPPVATPALPEGDRTLTVDGAPIAIHVHGRGPVCLVEPGGPGLEWTYLRMPLLEQSMTVVYVSPAGTAGSARPEAKDLTRARWAKDLEGVRAALGVDRVFLLGHSFGGMVAQLYALAHPEHLRGLILYSTTDRTDDEYGKARDQAVATLANEPWFADATGAFADEATATTDDAMTSVFHREAPLLFADWTHRQSEFAALIDSVHLYFPSGGAEPFDTRAELRKLKVPTLIVAGAHDVIDPPPFADELHANIKGSQLVVLPDSGHMGHVEDPDAFATAVLAFTSSH